MSQKKTASGYSHTSGSKTKQPPPLNKSKPVAKQASPPNTPAETDDLVEEESSLGNCTLFWLDENIDPEGDHYRLTSPKLRAIVSTVHVFNDIDTCIDHLKKIKKQKVLLVVCNTSGPQIVPRVHSMPQLANVFVFDSDVSIKTSWTVDWTKVKGAFTDATALCESIQEEVGRCEEDFLNISLIPTNSQSDQELDQLDQSFMYTKLIKEIILELPYDDGSITELVTYCQDKYKKEPKHLKTVDDFQNSYKAQTPIWWYTCESFVYNLLNWALRGQEVDAVISMAFYIRDLIQHIDELHQKQKKEFNKEFTVYRGQGIGPDVFERMKKTIGGLISFNNFLSTSSSRKVAMTFTERPLREDPHLAVLFIIKVDPTTSSVPFARISEVSYFKTEEEILFSMLSIFRITDITRSDEDSRLWYVYLKTTNDNDKQLSSLIERMRLEIDGSTALYRLGALMTKLGEYRKGEEVYYNLLRQTSDELEKGNIYFQLGHIKDNEQHYEEALDYYQRTLRIYQKYYSPDHQNIATCYNNIGLTYDNKNDYEQARQYYEKALEIYRKTLPEDHPNIGTCYNSLGLVSNALGDYKTALSYGEAALKILQDKLPSNHPLLATAHNNLGLVYINLKKYPEAIASYQRAVTIGQLALPPEHPSLQIYKQNLDSLTKKRNK